MKRAIALCGLLATATPAQIANLGGGCQAVASSPNGQQACCAVGLTTSGQPTPGTTMMVLMQPHDPSLICVFGLAIGFSNPNIALPSCGCTLRASIDAVSLRIYAPIFGPSFEHIALPANLPTGFTFYMQAVTAVLPNVPVTGCTESGTDSVILTNAVRATVL